MSNSGTMFLLGGADLSHQDPTNIHAFIETCKGRAGKIVVLTASPVPNDGQAIAAFLKENGAGIIEVAPLSQATLMTRADARDILSKAHGLMISGPNSLNLCRQLSGSAFAEILESRYNDGLHLAGAGSAAGVFCEHVLTHSEDGSTPRMGAATLTRGLGIIKSLIIDPFFGNRGPAGLLTALAADTFFVGLGLDSRSGVCIPPGTTIHAIGSGSVTVIDPAELEATNSHEVRGQEAVFAFGMKYHILTTDCCFDVATREANQMSLIQA